MSKLNLKLKQYDNILYLKLLKLQILINYI
jgi:hypothetical protein